MKRLLEARQPPSAAPRKPKALLGRDILVIGDSHADPDHSNRRFDWLGRMIADLQPSVVVDIGDWWSMNSLSSYEKPGSKTFASQAYIDDILAGIDAQWRTQAPSWERSDYSPRWVRTYGNHDDLRLQRALEQDPRRLTGIISPRHFLSEEFGWETYPYRGEVTIAGVTFSHYYRDTNSSYGAKYLAAQAIQNHHRSYVFGHAHRFDYRSEGPVYAACAGCFFEHEEHWLPPATQTRWDRGILMLRNVHQGRFDVDWWSLARVRAAYG